MQRLPFLAILVATHAYAQPTSGGGTLPDDVESAPTATATTPSRPAPTPLVEESAGPKFRNGFSLSAGQEFGTAASGADISGQLYGVDWRIGARINKALSVYVDSHLSLGTASVGGASGLTGNFATAVVGEYEFPFRLFVAGGGGYGVLNNPNGPLAQARVGYYPFAHKTGTARRLNVALDARWYFVEDVGMGVTVSHVALSLGYDRF